MSKSLQDQLLRAGLVSTKQVKQANASKSKKKKQQRHKKGLPVDSTQLEIEQKTAEKSERDRELNRKREQENQRRAAAAQIKQLVDENQIAEQDEGRSFHFEDNGKIKKVTVSDSIRLRIIDGQLAIVLSTRRYRIVPTEIALKIKARNESALIYLQGLTTNTSYPNEEVDPAYAEYKIPDDLTW